MMFKEKRSSELLMPAGSLVKLKAALLYGADAVYMGTPDMSLRTKSDFSLEQVTEGVNLAHSHGKKAYLTLNLFSHNKDIDKLPVYLETVRKVRPDGLIIADPGVFMFVRDYAPELEVHVSTQANICSWQSVKFWQNQGASLCVLGREVSFEELLTIREKCPDIKLEAFIHGSMCMTYSGRCLLSNFMVERGANQGNCANSCRWKYKMHMRLKDGTVKELGLSEENMELFEFLLEEECRPGEFLPIEEDERGAYILNAKDLCLMPKLDDYLAAGIDSLKVEGRGKSAYYISLVARAYRMAIDDWYCSPATWSFEPYMKELETIPNRGYTYAFHEGRLTNHAHGYENTSGVSAWEFAGIIQEVGHEAFLVEVKNKLEAGDVLEFISPVRKEPMLLRIYEFENAKNNQLTTTIHAASIRIPFALFDLEETTSFKNDFPPMTIIRKERSLLQDEWARLKLDKEAQHIELGKGSEVRYDKKRDALRQALEQKQRGRSSLRGPRMGLDGCCGKGCNGCLMFWYDPAYEKARGLIKQKKQGEKLMKNGREW